MTKLLIFASLLILCSRGDELISTRCHSQCLHQLEARLQEDPERRQALKHHILEMCKDDVQCTACSTPCKEAFTKVTSCKGSCSGSTDRQACEDSCDYLHNIFSEKPGSCPKVTTHSNYECSALCHLDGDCPETQKCCSVGCSRQCMNANASNKKLLPVPTNITVQERKRKRSIIIRWSQGSLSKEQKQTNSNLFLVQWRWGLRTEPSEMTEWQTVALRNKPYVILKHLLSPGRFYQFRLAAVSNDGSLGYSNPSGMFKLSKEAKAPPSPRDIILGDTKLTPIGLWNQNVQWKPPPSDLPIKNYQVSWAISSQEEAAKFELLMKKKAIAETTHEKRSLDDEEDFNMETREYHSLIVPSYATNTEVSGLMPNSVYIVEIYASVDSTDGELHGEKGMIFVRTGDSKLVNLPVEMVTEESFVEETTRKMDEKMTSPTIRPLLEVQTPYYDNELMTKLSWSCSSNPMNYVVRVRKTLCRQYEPNHNSDTRWHDSHVNDCHATIKGLHFDCDYKVEITESGSGRPIVDGIFSTETCEHTSSIDSIPCETLNSPLTCQVSSHTSAHCHWARHQDSSDTIVGYRIILSSPVDSESMTNINQPQMREMRYENLRPGFLYNVEVQSITNKGLGRTVSTQFMTHSEFNDDEIRRFPGGEIVELPLESSSAPEFLLLLPSICCLLVAWIF